MHLRPFVLLVGFVFLYTTPPVTITLFLLPLYFLLKNSNKSLLHTMSHDIYILFMVMVSFHYIYTSTCKKRKMRDYLPFIHLSYITFSSQWRIC